MVTGIMFLNVKRDAINPVAQRIARMDGVSEVYSIAGEYDLVVIARVGNNEELADLVTNHVLQTSGITDSETHVALKVHSRHDLERMFSVGQPPTVQT